MQIGKIIGRSVGTKGGTEGSCDKNPSLNSLVSDVKFPYGQAKECSSNDVAESIL